jgi:hypothetical protein
MLVGTHSGGAGQNGAIRLAESRSQRRDSLKPHLEFSLTPVFCDLPSRAQRDKSTNTNINLALFIQRYGLFIRESIVPALTSFSNPHKMLGLFFQLFGAFLASPKLRNIKSDDFDSATFPQKG